MLVTRCFDIGGTKLVAADVSENGDVREQARIPTATHSFTDFVEALRTHCPDNNHAIGISIAGVIAPGTGLINSANIPCITHLALAAELAQALARPVHVINDANAFALAEASFGIAKTHRIVLAIILGTGVGGGIVIDGNILNGAGGTSGEWGHGPVSTARTRSTIPEVPCQCGQPQCLDTLGGARGLERLHKHICAESIDSEAIISGWQSGDINAAQTVDVWLDIVGGALANVVNIIGPSIVVVGGGLANSQSLITALDTEVGNRRLAIHQPPLLYTAVQGPEQGLLGAYIHCRNQQV